MSVSAEQRATLKAAGFRRVERGRWVDNGDPGLRRLTGTEALALVRERNPDPFANARPADDFDKPLPGEPVAWDVDEPLPGEPLPGEPVVGVRSEDPSRNGPPSGDATTSAASAHGAGEEPSEATSSGPIVFVTLREFLDLDFPPAASLVGRVRGGTNLLPCHGWAMFWGAEGCGKTSIVADLIAHGAEGREWQGYEIAQPIRFVVVVNEGVPGGFQDKLAEKLEHWPGDRDALLDRVAFYASPWGRFTLRDERMFERLRSYAHDFGADYVVLDPLHTVGPKGAGAPEDTEEFKRVLQRLGVWESLGVITPHHSNKAGMVSGDWGRHPDTLVRLEKDGDRAATRWTLQKARPADPLELHKVRVLEWETETLGYRFVERTPEAVGASNREAVFTATEDGHTTVEALAKATGLRDRTVRRHLEALAEDGRVRLARGPRNALLVVGAGDEMTLEDV